MLRVFVTAMWTAAVLATLALVLVLVGAGMSIWTESTELDRIAGRIAGTGGILAGTAFLVGWGACCPIKGGPLDAWEKDRKRKRTEEAPDA